MNAKPLMPHSFPPIQSTCLMIDCDVGSSDCAYLVIFSSNVKHKNLYDPCILPCGHIAMAVQAWGTIEIVRLGLSWTLQYAPNGVLHCIQPVSTDYSTRTPIVRYPQVIW